MRRGLYDFGDTVERLLKLSRRPTGRMHVSARKSAIALPSSPFDQHDAVTRAEMTLPRDYEYRSPPAPIHAVFAEGAQPSQKVRLFTDHLIEVFSALHGDTRFAPYRRFVVERMS
jgi:hypothetical protein